MYSVFLVDDEIVIREGIRNHFLWEASDFVLTGEAPDGEVALAMLEDIRPDILITDIRMPFMDGLELVRRARERMPWLHVLVLSGYDEFSYARQAFTLGVHDYLLKPVSAEDLLRALEKVAAHIEKQRRDQADMQSLKEQFAANSQYLKEKVIQELFQPHISEAALTQIQERASRLGVILRANCYAMLLIKPVGGEGMDEDALAVTAQLRRLAGIGGAVHFCECGGEAAMLVMGDGDADLDGRAYALAQTIRHELTKTLGIDARISLGKTVHSLRDVPESLAQARKVARAADDANRPILGLDDLPGGAGFTLAELDVLPIQQQIPFVTGADVDGVLDRFLESLGEVALHSKMMVHYVYVEIMLAASRVVKESGGNPVEVLPENSEHMLEAIESMGEVRSVLRDILTAAIGFREASVKTKHAVMIRKAKAYLEDRYQDPAVSLKEVAEHVALSNSHFCTVFSQETGGTFTEYLTCLRLNKAKEMMRNPAMRTSQIAYCVGYNDPHYFSYLFKRYVGVSPREYRREMEEAVRPQ